MKDWVFESRDDIAVPLYALDARDDILAKWIARIVIQETGGEQIGNSFPNSGRPGSGANGGGGVPAFATAAD